MGIRGDSYSSTTDVRYVTQHLLDGFAGFNSSTNPPVGAVERFIDMASGQLNLALWAGGFNPSVIRANSTAKVTADAWVTAEAARWVEVTRRGQGYNDQEGSRTAGFKGLRDRADTWVKNNARGLKYMGLDVAVPSSAGLTFTGLAAPADRTDPDDTSLAQPRFTKSRFDDPSIANGDDD